MACAKKNFDRVIVLVNCPSAMELGCLEHDDEVDAILWIGQPGWNGIASVGKILNGEINPSGRTVDFYPADFAADPTWYNFGDYTQAKAIINGEAGETGAVLSMGYDEVWGRYNTQSFEWVVDGEDNYLRRWQMPDEGEVAPEEEY